MNGRDRLSTAFAACAAEDRAALLAFLALGDPDFATTRALARAACNAGADVIELGFPFSDPLADGPVIQAAYSRALAAGATTDACFECVSEITAGNYAPVALMTAWNIVLARGSERFCADAAAAGAAAVLVPDLLVEDADDLAGAAAAHGLAVPLLVGPDSDATRVAAIARRSTGFVYLLRRRGVTGAGAASDDLSRQLDLLRQHGSAPVAVGFGISSPDDARAAARVADGVIVGSALVQVGPDVHAVADAVRAFADACRRPVHARSA